MRVFLIFLFIFLFIGCGRKTPPLPVEKSIPQEAEITYEPTPFGINIWITLPEKTQGGYPLTKIQYVEIERKEEPLDPEGKIKIKRIKLKVKLHSAGRSLIFTDSELKPGFKYTYRIKIKRDFLVETPYYGEKTLYWTNPPSIVRDLSLSVSNDELNLKWNPPSENLKGDPLVEEIFYSIEQIKNGEIKYFNIKETYFKKKYSPGEKVCFRVKAYLNYLGTLIPGPYSQKLCYP